MKKKERFSKKGYEAYIMVLKAISSALKHLDGVPSEDNESLKDTLPKKKYKKKEPGF